jgi:AmmeMemoRadiSam system protein B/AmmeMemoRadiSam system protein A
VAGQFYPSDPDQLSAAIDDYLDDTVTPSNDRPIAIVCPHAGYIYSGQIAADAYRQASTHDYDLIVILGANHTTAGFGKVSVYPGGGYMTPFGIAEIDEDLAAELIEADDDFTFREAVHSREHSIEVQIPFIQRVFPNAKILPAVVGTPDRKLCVKFGEALASAIKDRSALIVASCDLSHFPAYEDAKRVDRTTLEAMATLDVKTFQTTCRQQLNQGISNLSTSACGEAPITTAIVAARKLGATGARIISYANSGDVSVGDRSRVVGYGAVAFVKDSDADEPSPREPGEKRVGTVGLTVDHEDALLSFARKTIRQYLTSGTTPLARGFDPVLESEKGVFVTLRKQDRLRGCIGHMADDLPLCQAVGYCALQAAFNDRRFSPVELDELADIEIEVSVLTPFQPVGGYEDIRIGRDGVLLEKDGRSAVYLPSVAVEQGWNREEMLSHLCVKAGLPPDGWKTGTRFYTFQATAFSESDLR